MQTKSSIGFTNGYLSNVAQLGLVKASGFSINALVHAELLGNHISLTLSHSLKNSPPKFEKSGTSSLNGIGE